MIRICGIAGEEELGVKVLMKYHHNMFEGWTLKTGVVF